MSHVFKNIRISDGDLVGDLIVFKTPLGLILQELIDNGVDLQTNLSCVAILDSSGNPASDFSIISIDMEASYGVRMT